MEKAKGSSLGELKDECARVKASADDDAEEKGRRIHRNRFLRHYTDTEGAGNIHVRNNVEMVAAIMSALQPMADRLEAEAKARGERESAEAYAVDSLNELARMGPWVSSSARSSTTLTPRSMMAKKTRREGWHPMEAGPTPGALAEGEGAETIGQQDRSCRATQQHEHT